MPAARRKKNSVVNIFCCLTLSYFFLDGFGKKIRCHLHVLFFFSMNVRYGDMNEWIERYKNMNEGIYQRNKIVIRDV